MIGTVRCVGIQENIGVPFMKNPGKTFGIFRIALGKIAVQVEVGSISSKSGFDGSGLIGAVESAAVQMPANIVNRNDYNSSFLKQLVFCFFISQQVIGKLQACINSRWFTGMNTIIYQ